MTHRGSTTVEMVVITPVLVVLLAFAVGCGRWIQASMTVRSAADQAARAASLVSSQRMRGVGLAGARGLLAGDRSGCIDPRADIVVSRSGKLMFVRATAECRVDRRGLLGLFGLPSVVRATSSEVVDVFTFR